MKKKRPKYVAFRVPAGSDLARRVHRFILNDGWPDHYVVPIDPKDNAAFLSRLSAQADLMELPITTTLVDERYVFVIVNKRGIAQPQKVKRPGK